MVLAKLPGPGLLLQTFSAKEPASEGVCALFLFYPPPILTCQDKIRSRSRRSVAPTNSQIIRNADVKLFNTPIVSGRIWPNNLSYSYRGEP